jgi:hypothetical protein
MAVEAGTLKFRVTVADASCPVVLFVMRGTVIAAAVVPVIEAVYVIPVVLTIDVPAIVPEPVVVIVPVCPEVKSINGEVRPIFPQFETQVRVSAVAPLPPVTTVPV